MRTMNHREYLTRLAWIKERWNCPSRTDHYLMQIAMEVRSVLAKNRKKIKLKHFLFKFGKNNSPKVDKVAAEKSASVWKALLGIKD